MGSLPELAVPAPLELQQGCLGSALRFTRPRSVQILIAVQKGCSFFPQHVFLVDFTKLYLFFFSIINMHVCDCFSVQFTWGGAHLFLETSE